jgi:hypothetical protein
VRIFATVNDAVSGVGKVEGFIDTVEAEGTGFLFSPVDGEFGPVGTEDVYADIPLSSVRSLTPGDHDIFIRAQDKAGNWGLATAPTFLDIVSAPPQVTTVTYDSSGPAPGTLAVTGTAYGVGVTIAAIEYRVGLTAVGPFTPMTFTGGAVATATLNPRPTIPPGNNLWVQVQDSEGQWSAVYQLLP